MAFFIRASLATTCEQYRRAGNAPVVRRPSWRPSPWPEIHASRAPHPSTPTPRPPEHHQQKRVPCQAHATGVGCRAGGEGGCGRRLCHGWLRQVFVRAPFVPPQTCAVAALGPASSSPLSVPRPPRRSWTAGEAATRSQLCEHTCGSTQTRVTTARLDPDGCHNGTWSGRASLHVLQQMSHAGARPVVSKAAVI